VPTDRTSSLTIRLFNGARQPFVSTDQIIFTVIDGHDRQFRRFTHSPNVEFDGLPFYDNLFDDYRVVVWTKGYLQTGYAPLRLSADRPTTLDLMLVPRAPVADLSSATWDAIKARIPLLTAGDGSDAQGRMRYETLRSTRPTSLAALFNITTAMAQITLASGRSPLDYLQEVKWDDSLAQDRFFAYTDPALIDQLELATQQGDFEPEPDPGAFHAGATRSWKQVRFETANVQITFHEDDSRKVINGMECVVVEPDIDYFKDPLAHLLLEVVPHKFSGGLTNPEVVYVLRWAAGRVAGGLEFAPPYVVVAL